MHIVRASVSGQEKEGDREGKIQTEFRLVLVDIANL